MNTQALQNLISQTITAVNRIVIAEGSEVFELDDSLVLRNSSALVQVLNEGGKISISRVMDISELKIWDDFDRTAVGISLREVCPVKKPNAVKYIHNFSHGDHYLFGSKCLDQDDNFIMGFCYGFDEIIYQDEHEFELLLGKYTGNVNVSIISA